MLLYSADLIFTLSTQAVFMVYHVSVLPSVPLPPLAEEHFTVSTIISSSYLDYPQLPVTTNNIVMNTLVNFFNGHL